MIGLLNDMSTMYTCTCRVFEYNQRIHIENEPFCKKNKPNKNGQSAGTLLLRDRLIEVIRPIVIAARQHRRLEVDYVSIHQPNREKVSGWLFHE